MFRSAQRTGKFATAAMAFVALSGLTGCLDGGFRPGSLRVPIGNDPEMTGGLTPDGRPLTAASGDHDIQDLKKRVDTKVADNVALAQAIVAAEITRVDSDGKPVQRNPDKLKITITFKPGYIAATEAKFVGVLAQVQSAGTVGFSEVSATTQDASRFTLSAVCADRECNKTTLHLTQRTDSNTGSRSAVAALIVRQREASIQTRIAGAASADFKKSTHLEPLRRMLEAGAIARYETVEVAWGISKFALQIEAPPAKFCISGLLVETNDSDEPLSTACNGQAGTGVRAILVGNNNRGGLIINLIEDGAVLVMTALPRDITSQPEKPDVPSEEIVPVPTDPIPTSPALPTDPPTAVPATAPVVGRDTAKPGTPRIPVDIQHSVTRQWEKDRGRAEINAAARVWVQAERSRTQQFLARIQPNLPLMTRTLNKHRVPNEFLTITMIESRYFVDAGYPVEVNSASTATGPWQFLESTGRWLGLTTRPFRPGRKADPCDERAQLEPATNAAGRYFRMLLDEFPHDPRLAVMSYYWGNGNVNNAVNCLQKESCISRRLGEKGAARVAEIKRGGFDFWLVKEFNMAPRAATSYVVNFVSGQFVLREPERYGLPTIDPRSIGATQPAPARTCK